MSSGCVLRLRLLFSRPSEGRPALAKPNYRQQKRQKELSRKSRQAERLQRRTSKLEGDDTNPEGIGAEGTDVTGLGPTEASTTVPAPEPGHAPKVTP